MSDAIQMEDMEDDTTNEMENKYLLFLVDQESYGISIASVVNIMEVQEVTPVPEMPDYIIGVINLRGMVIPVMDIRLRLGMPTREYDERTCIIICKEKGKQIGIVVDTVAEVQNIPENQLEPPRTFSGAGTRSSGFVSSLAKVGEKVKIIVDVAKLLGDFDPDEVSQDE